jgi:pimeloyl-ACP methyl ester carboxylesterase
MKKILTLCFLLMIFCVQVMAQYPIGHQSLTYQDPARSNRNVSCEVYYPATSAGETTPFATGQFPVIVFGHGFVMAYSAYAYFKDAMVPLGYIVVFATTETSMSPVHLDFGLDLAFLLNKIKSESTNSASPFYNKLSATSAIMGHSMGGGSSFLACENNTVPTCMVTFAAAETDPSSTTAAANVTIPTLVMAGDEDCVAPPADNQIPMYNALASSCKVYISILDGCHCYFADYNFNCIFGEQTCNTTPDLDRPLQQDATLDFVELYLDFYLKGNAAAWNTFNDSLVISPRITHQISCPTTGVNEIENNTVSVWPNPINNEINISFNADGAYSIEIADITGKVIMMENKSSATGTITEQIDVSELSNGIYIVELKSSDLSIYKKIIKN